MLSTDHWPQLAGVMLIVVMTEIPGLAQDQAERVGDSSEAAVSASNATTAEQTANTPSRSGARCHSCGAPNHGRGSPTLISIVSSWWKSKKPRHQDKWLGYADEFCEQPLGACVDDHVKVQSSKGTAALMVLHQFDFDKGSDKLNGRGKDELKRIAALLPRKFSPVVIERSNDSDLDEQRRQMVLNQLSRGSFPIPPERVKVEVPDSRGLNGVEAELVNTNLLNQTQTRGNQGGVTGVSSGSTLGQGAVARPPSGSY